MTLTAKREWGPHPDQKIGGDLNGRWVVRDPDGAIVDIDKYRNDLMARYPGLVVQGRGD